MNIAKHAVVFLILVVTTSALPVVTRQDSQYKDLTNNFDCPRSNDAEQKAAYPQWAYDAISPTAAKQSLAKAWEPILEPVQGCNGFDDGWLKQFSFLVVLDGSWVRYYYENSKHFASQGYNTLNDSPNLLFDRVTYLFERQFGARVSINRVFSFPELGEACATNEAYVDDGTDRTSTRKALAQAGIVPLAVEGGTLRLGVGSFTTGQYCHSYSPVSGLCNPSAIFTNQKRPFATDNSGKIQYETIRTLAHEMGHFFGVCPGDNPHCLKAHTQNELPDIMVYDGRPATNARPEGMFSKFLTSCTPLYEDTVCHNIKKASATCGLVVAPPSIRGEYFCSKYGANANDWHYVTITENTPGKLYTWKNRAGVSWTLTRNSADSELFDVGRTCPYYKSGYKVGRVSLDKDSGAVVGFFGPWNELYDLQ